MKWMRIINKGEEEYNQKVDDIYQVLKKNHIGDISEFGLYHGQSGICLFLRYYSLYKKVPIDLECLVNQMIDGINSTSYSTIEELTTFSEFAWFLCQFYRQIGNKKKNDYFEDLDENLAEVMFILLQQDRYDCLNGAINIGLYFYKRYVIGNPKVKNYLFKFIEILQNKAIREKGYILKWVSIIDIQTYEKGYNLGIAHGIPGLMLFLSKLYQIEEFRSIVSLLLVGGCNYLITQKNGSIFHPSLFAGVVHEKESSNEDVQITRLGWCYGDMSVGYALYKVSQLRIPEMRDLESLSMDILHQTIRRKNVDFRGISEKMIQNIQIKLNNRPIKKNEYRKPIQVILMNIE